MKLSTLIYIERGDDEIELKVTGTYHPGHPGKTSGLPENCFPPEPAEVEVEAIFGPDGKPFVFASPEEEATAQEKAESAIYEEVENTDDDGPDPDAEYDSRMDREMDDPREDHDYEDD